MSGEIDKIIKEKKLTPVDCAYHTRRELENKGKVRILLIKGETTAHVEVICPHCGHPDYRKEEWKKVSKAAKIRLSFKCSKCGKTIKVEKLKGKK